VTIIVNCGKYSKSLDLKIYPDPGVVGISLLAGAPGGPGDDDGLGSQARFNGIRYFTIDAHGNLYVTSSDPDKFGTQAIRKVTPDGMVTTLTSRFSGGTDGARGVAKIANPRQIAVDSHGTLYFIDDYGLRSLGTSMSASGLVSTLSSLNNVCPHYLASCSSLLIGKNDEIFVFDKDLIYKFGADGSKVIFAGQRQDVPVNVDGQGLRAGFVNIGAVLMDSDESFYFFDDDNLRKISADATVTTIAHLPQLSQENNGTCQFSDLVLDKLHNFRFTTLCRVYPPFNGSSYLVFAACKLDSSGTVTKTIPP
jgi:hypothetical protein